MELERDIVGVLETVSIVNDFRSLNKKRRKPTRQTSSPLSYRKKVYKMVKDSVKTDFPFLLT